MEKRNVNTSWLVVDIIGLSVLVVLVFLLGYKAGGPYSKNQQSFYSSVLYCSSSYFAEQPATSRAVLSPISSKIKNVHNEHCTMGSCFNISQCRLQNGFKVYIYPSKPGKQHSPLFKSILTAIKESPYITEDPNKACLFVPSLDLLDRDVHSKYYWKNLPPLSSLPHWNGGRNHIIFVQYSGTWPSYSDFLDFPTGMAIIARASFNISLYREGFDVSLPLISQQLVEKDETYSEAKVFPLKRKYLLGFKGKRYLYGQGSEVRSSVHHLHNGKEVVMLTTCKHNRDWVKYTDRRCIGDNSLYDQYNYLDLLDNSSYCLIPRGRRLGSFRFLESLQTSCIPVSLSNGYILPFSEVLDWKISALIVDERQLLQVPYLVRRIPPTKLLSLRLHTKYLWNTYFTSVNKIILTVLQVIQARLRSLPRTMWNNFPGYYFIRPEFSMFMKEFPSRAPVFTETSTGYSWTHFTVIIVVARPSRRASAPLLKLIHELLAHCPVAQIILLWTGLGSPKVFNNFPVKVKVVSVGKEKTQWMWPPEVEINTTAVLHLHEDVYLNRDEVNFGFSVWQSFSSQLVGYVGHSHSWDPIRGHWTYITQPHNYFSILSLQPLFYHRYYGYLMAKGLPIKLQAIADTSASCLGIVLNSVVAIHTRSPSILLPYSSLKFSAVSKEVNNERTCLNMAINVLGQTSLITSFIKFDPLLYKDNVSNYRKYFHKLE